MDTRPNSVGTGLRQLGRGGVQHVLIAGGSRLIAFAGVAVLIRRLGTREFGVYAIALLNEQVLFIIVGYAIVNAMGKFYSDSNRGLRSKDEVVGTAVVSILGFGVIGALLWQVVAAPIARITLIDSSSAVTVSRLIGVSVAGSLVLNVVMSIWLLDIRMKPFAVANFGQYGLGVALGALLVIRFDLGAEGAFAGWTIGTVATAVWALIWVARRYRFAFNARLLREMLVYGTPLIPGAIVMLGLQVNDRYILRGLGGLSEVAVYAAVITVATGLNATIVAAFKRIWTAWMWKMREHPDEEEFHRRVLTYYVAGQALLVLALAVFGAFIMDALSGGIHGYIAFGGAVAIVYGGFALFGTFDVFAAGYFFSGRTIYYSVSVAVATAVSIVFNLALVRSWGIWAAAVSNPVAYGVLAWLSWHFGRRYFRVGFEWLRMLRILAIVAALGGVALSCQAVFGSAGQVVAVLVTMAAPLVVYRFGLSPEERAAVLGTVRGRALLGRLRRSRTP